MRALGSCNTVIGSDGFGAGRGSKWLFISGGLLTLMFLVTRCRKLSNCFRESALCSVSSGRMDGNAGVPSAKITPKLTARCLSGLNVSPEYNCTSFRSGAEDEPLMTAVLKRLRVEPVPEIQNYRTSERAKTGYAIPNAGRSTTLHSLR